MSQHLSEQEIFRRKSLEELLSMGINPYPAALYPVNCYSEEIHAGFDANPDAYKIGRAHV